MSTPSTEIAFPASHQGISCGSSAQHAATEPYEPPSVIITSDILHHMIQKCSPEIVEHVFSFTTRDHASAAGFFRVALSLVPKTGMGPDEANPLSYAMKSGDLPLLRYLFLDKTTSYVISESDWSVTSNCLSDFTNANVRAYAYLHLLIDCRAGPTRTNALAHEHHPKLHSRLRLWATRKPDTEMLDLLHRSKFARSGEHTPYACWSTVTSTRQTRVLEYAHLHTRFCPGQDAGALLSFALENNWGAGIEFLHETCGLRSPSWTPANLYQLLNPDLYTDAREVMQRLGVVPEDMCEACRDRWLPRIGYWGLVAAYREHGTDATVHEPVDGDAFPESLCNAETILMLVLKDALLRGDEAVIRYLGTRASGFAPPLWMFYWIMTIPGTGLLRIMSEMWMGPGQFLYVLPAMARKSILRRMLVAAEGKMEKCVMWTAIERAMAAELEKVEEDWVELMRKVRWEETGERLKAFIKRLRTSEVLEEKDYALINFW